jgi:hypothetical protein
VGRFSAKRPEKRTIRELRRWRVLKDALPLHNRSAMTWLRHNWVAAPCLSVAAVTATFPINEVCRFLHNDTRAHEPAHTCTDNRDAKRRLKLLWAVSFALVLLVYQQAYSGLTVVFLSYFMEDTAFFFAWGKFYNRWLVAPALLGLGVFIYNMVCTPRSNPLASILR